MSARPTVFNRIAQWFRGSDSGEMLPLLKEVPQSDEAPATPRFSLFRPFARRDAAIASLQQGFTTLTELMSAIRENLERQGRRQDEMLSYLSHLPEILQAMPEARRIQGETLKSIGQQLANQVQQQNRLADILAKVTESNGTQRQVLEALHKRVETLSEHNQSIAANLRQVGQAVENVGRSSASTSQVLQQFQQSIANHEGASHELLKRQNNRLTALLAVSIVLSLLALGAVGAMGYLMLRSVSPQSAAPAVPATQPAQLEQAMESAAAPLAMEPTTQPMTADDVAQ